MRTAHDLADAIETAKAGQDCMVKCPAHDDGQASLHVSPGKSQPVAMFCHAGCTTDQILAAGGITWEDISKPKEYRDDTAIQHEEWTPAGPASHIYPYNDENGKLLFQVLRIPLPGGAKTFRQRHWDAEANRWRWSMEGVRRVPYRLPEALQARDEGLTIWIPEGEKDVDTIRRLGEPATCNPMGAGKWLPEFGKMLAGSTVAIISDADATGRAHARMVRDDLLLNDCQVKIYEAPNGYKDVTKLIQGGGSLADLVETVPEEEERRDSYGVDVLDIVQRELKEEDFVVPGVFARGDRMIITGFEGAGKSMLLRQLGLMIAAGIHPWTWDKIPPKKVIVIDAENHPNQTLAAWQDLVGRAAKADRPLQRGMLTVLEEWDSGLDLISPEGYAWMMERMHAYKPDVVCLGPLYNIVSRDFKDDETARKFKTVVNDARAVNGSVMLMEHHAPLKHPTDKVRAVRPYGSSILLRWPEFGFGLNPTEKEGVYEWQKTRLPRVRGRDFPEYLRWGKHGTNEWPWTPGFVDEHGVVY